jgi:hypothetical protein
MSDYFLNNFESGHAFFEGHAPGAHKLPSGRWVAHCDDGCIDPDEPGVLIHADRDAAAEQAAHILAGRIHGPTDTEGAR